MYLSVTHQDRRFEVVLSAPTRIFTTLPLISLQSCAKCIKTNAFDITISPKTTHDSSKRM
jgi:hypothetical protein